MHKLLFQEPVYCHKWLSVYDLYWHLLDLSYASYH